MCCPFATLTDGRVIAPRMTSNLQAPSEFTESSGLASTMSNRASSLGSNEEATTSFSDHSPPACNPTGRIPSTVPRPTRRASKRSAPPRDRENSVYSTHRGQDHGHLASDNIHAESNPADSTPPKLEAQVASRASASSTERMPSIDLHPLSTDSEGATIQGLAASSLFRRRLSRRNLQRAKAVDSATTAAPLATGGSLPSSSTAQIKSANYDLTSTETLGLSICSISTAQSTGNIRVLSIDSPYKKLATASFADLHSAAADQTRPPYSVPSPGNFKKLLRDRYLSSQGRLSRDQLAAGCESTGNLPLDEQKRRTEQLLNALETLRNLVNCGQQSTSPLGINNLGTIDSAGSPGRFVPQAVPYRREHSVPWNAELAQTLPKYQALASQLDENQLQLPDLMHPAYLRSPSSWPLIPQTVDDIECPDPAKNQSQSSEVREAISGVNSTSENMYLDKSHIATCPFARVLSNLAFDLSRPGCCTSFCPPLAECTQSQSAPISPQHVSDGNTMPVTHSSVITSLPGQPLSHPLSHRSINLQETGARIDNNASLDRPLESFVFSAPMSKLVAVTTPSQPNSSSTDSAAFCQWTSPKLSPISHPQTQNLLGVPLSHFRSKPLGAFVFPPPSPIPPVMGSKSKQQGDTPLSSLSWISSLSTGSLTDSTGSPGRLDDVKDQSAALVELMSNLARVQSIQSPICLSKPFSPNSSFTVQSPSDGQTHLPAQTDLPPAVTSYRRSAEKRRRTTGSRSTAACNMKSIVVSMASTGPIKNASASTRTRSSTTTGAGTHVCPICSRQFNRSDMLVRHLHVHTGSRPFECRECGQAFSRSDHLSTHQRTHTGHRPYRCSLCSYSACRRDMITRHLRVHQRRGQRERMDSASNPQLVTSQPSDPNIPQELVLFNETGSERGKKLATSRSAPVVMCETNFGSTTTVNATNLPSS